jgi:hypothetical protein
MLHAPKNEPSRYTIVGSEQRCRNTDTCDRLVYACTSCVTLRVYSHICFAVRPALAELILPAERILELDNKVKAITPSDRN